MNVLIAGGTGLVGSRLTEMLIKKGYTVHILTRKKLQNSISIKYFQWVIGKSIEEGAFENLSGIINLTGEGIADGRWTNSQKERIMNSRTQSADFLGTGLKDAKISVPVYISASGINYYANSKTKKYIEVDPAGNGFVQAVCVQWEKHAFDLQPVANRVVVLRTGLVLASQKSFLQKFTFSTKFMVGAVFGDGKQFISWIHIDDLCRYYIKSLEDTDITGAYNAGVCEDENQNSFLKTFKNVYNTNFIPFKIPKFVSKLIFGEMAILLNGGVAVSHQKMLETGFELNYPSLKTALEDLKNKT
ncbi:TIGR01777 family protein [Putridiphycobacter roseus]|uniref:TIGR01777 family protein n=1 Tax=Putridiphycobacter roseus TaxID=2219161 RepID=A0A2W1NLT4_9FLAO|nr:TIGR01777 family oxidoreductase [Putridiphycobacter roseus]PZE15688.1 TIGR01777 family protein [Putridiphycobacter roseus]